MTRHGVRQAEYRAQKNRVEEAKWNQRLAAEQHTPPPAPTTPL